MSPTPEIDPHWVRRRSAQGPDHAMTAALIVCLVVAVIGGYVAKDYAAREDALDRSRQVSAAMVNEQQRRTAAAANEIRLAKQAEVAEFQKATQRREGIGSSINGRAMHRCGYAGTAYLQLGPCKAPFIEMPADDSATRAQRAWEVRQMQARADAKLIEAQSQFAASGNAPSNGAWSPSYNESVISERAKCKGAKAQRDEAYRVAGNNRGFEFIRRWNDYVFEACKSS